MGLDMYLEARVRTYRTYGDEKPDATRAALEAAAKKVGLPKSDNIDFISLSREVAYWRKANQIHKWFVDNVQDGKDDCGDYEVDREQLQTLRDLCQQVLDASELVDAKVVNGYTYSNGVETPCLEDGQVIKDPSLAKKLLPTQQGFFFGGSDYDQWYIDDLKETVRQIDKCLALPEEVDFCYHSSW